MYMRNIEIQKILKKILKKKKKNTKSIRYILNKSKIHSNNH